MHFYLDLADTVHISAEALVIPIEPPLNLKKRFQEVCIAIPSGSHDGATGVNTFSDGTEIEVNLEIKSIDGRWHELIYSTVGIKDYDPERDLATLTSIRFKIGNKDDMRESPFDAIRVRSSRPFTSSKIYFHDYNRK